MSSQPPQGEKCTAVRHTCPCSIHQMMREIKRMKDERNLARWAIWFAVHKKSPTNEQNETGV